MVLSQHMTLNTYLHSKRIHVINLCKIYSSYFINVLESVRISFSHSVAAILGQWVSRHQWEGFFIPLIPHSVKCLAVPSYCLYCWLQPAPLKVRISVSKYSGAQNCLRLLHLCREMPAQSPSPHTTGEKCAATFITFLRAEILEHCKNLLTASKTFADK